MSEPWDKIVEDLLNPCFRGNTEPLPESPHPDSPEFEDKPTRNSGNDK